MASFNKVILAGNLTRDPQLSTLPSGTPVVELGIACNRRWKGKDGSSNEEVTYVDVRSYGRQAEVINQYFNKGKPILIEGRLKFDQWEGKDGGKRSKLYVVMEGFSFVGNAGGGGGGGGGGRDEPGHSDEMPPVSAGADGGMDDIPF